MTKPAFLIGALIALGAGAGGCASNTAYNPPPRLDDDTRTVSCKLPPQIRRLGQHATYLAAGRIVRTNAGDCRVRGGQITELASVASDPVVAADGTMAVMIGGDGGQSACPVSGQIARLKSGSTLNVRANVTASTGKDITVGASSGLSIDSGATLTLSNGDNLKGSLRPCIVN